MSAPIRRTRRDLIAAGIIAALTALCVLIAVLSAPIRSSHLEPAAAELENAGRLAVVPGTLTESFRLADASPNAAPLVVEGVIVTYSDGTVTGTTPQGDTAWTYKRKNELCGLSQAWGKVVAVYRNNAGCGDVVAINARTGQYSGTRSSVAPEEVTAIHSNDRVGTVSASRIELWRSDMVRTVEYGEVEAPQEPDMQPHQCQITSALTRTELLANTEICEDGAYLRFQNVTPEDSRKPEMYGSVAISQDAFLVAVSPDAAAIYDPAESQIRAYNKDGNLISSSAVPALTVPEALASGAYPPDVADLPHHMTYHQGDYLVLMEPGALAATGVFQGALGTGFPAGDRLLYASDGGIAVINWDANSVDRVIPVDRGGYTGPISIDSAGTTIVEKRGSEVVVLSAS